MKKSGETSFSEYQRDRIARFAAASESLHQNRLLLTTPGMARPALALAMRAKKTPAVSEQSLQRTTEAFRHLCAYRERAKRIDRIWPVVLVIGVALTAYLWPRVSPAIGIGTALLVVLAAAGLKLYYSYLALRPILERFKLTDEEAQFAMNEVIAEARWQSRG